MVENTEQKLERLLRIFSKDPKLLEDPCGKGMRVLYIDYCIRIYNQLGRKEFRHWINKYETVKKKYGIKCSE